jgi:Outer membrane protein Omp28
MHAEWIIARRCGILIAIKLLYSCFLRFYMKRISFALAAFVLLFASCKENDAPIFTKGSGNVSTILDTTYVLNGAALASLTASPHRVLVEEFSGQSCANCPSGHADLDALATSHPDSFNYVVMYGLTGIYGGLVIPPSGAKNDFEDSVAESIITTVGLGNNPGLPNALIDRTPTGTDGIVIPHQDWDADIVSKFSTPDSVNLSLSSTYSGGKALITATVTYTQNVSTKQNLTLMLVEDSIIDRQADGITTDTAYMFMSVFRGIVSSPPLGDPILDTMATKERGRVYVHTYSYALPTITGHPAIQPANCRIVGCVNAPGSADYHVLQSAQCKLMGP